MLKENLVNLVLTFETTLKFQGSALLCVLSLLKRCQNYLCRLQLDTLGESIGKEIQLCPQDV